MIQIIRQIQLEELMQRGQEHFRQKFHTKDSFSQQISTSKAKHSAKLLSINEIIQKNKQVKGEKKMQKLKTIQARKLRIKVTEVFHNFFPLKNSLSQRLSTTSKQSSRSQNLKRGPSLLIKREYMQFQNRNPSRLKGSTSKKIEEDTIDVEAVRKREEAIIQLFGRFSKAELEQIQQDELYYLGREELTVLFKKFLMRKISNSKDTSRASLMRDSYSKCQVKYVELDTLTTQQAKNYIIDTIGLQREQNPRKLSLHLLTNPLEKPRVMTFQQSKPLYKSFKTLQELKQKQKINLSKLRAKEEQDRLNCRLDRDYIAGVVRENKAVVIDQRKLKYSQKNSLHDVKSKQFQDRLRLIKEDYGKSVCMAEQMRASFLRLKTKTNNCPLFK